MCAEFSCINGLRRLWFARTCLGIHFRSLATPQPSPTTRHQHQSRATIAWMLIIMDPIIDYRPCIAYIHAMLTCRLGPDGKSKAEELYKISGHWDKVMHIAPSKGNGKGSVLLDIPSLQVGACACVYACVFVCPCAARYIASVCPRATLLSDGAWCRHSSVLYARSLCCNLKSRRL